MEAEIKQAIDPVCGMTVDPDSAKARVDYLGKTYYFCCASCAKKFDAAPEQFLKPNPPRLVMPSIRGKTSPPPTPSGIVGSGGTQLVTSEIGKEPVCGM